MKVFLSWSGKKSQYVAKSFRDWLPYLLNNSEPWMSELDIQAGTRWNEQIASELEKSKLGILFVTTSNTREPWLLFEAGALAKTIAGTHLCPYLINLQPSQLPDGP